MTVINPTLQPTEPTPVSSLVRGARFVYYATTVILLASIMLQVFFAGAALLASPTFLETHRAFARVLEGLSILLPIMALVARLSWRITLLSLLPFVLIGMQYAFLYAMTGMGLPLWTRGLHAANALVIYWIALRLSRMGWQSWRGPAA